MAATVERFSKGAGDGQTFITLGSLDSQSVEISKGYPFTEFDRPYRAIRAEKLWELRSSQNFRILITIKLIEFKRGTEEKTTVINVFSALRS